MARNSESPYEINSHASLTLALALRLLRAGWRRARARLPPSPAIRQPERPWNIIIDPYDTGYRDYRQQAYDASPKPSGGYFLDRPPANPSELVEYNFDASPQLQVPGDWNSQDPKLFYYEGTVWVPPQV